MYCRLYYQKKAVVKLYANSFTLTACFVEISKLVPMFQSQMTRVKSFSRVITLGMSVQEQKTA